MIRYTCTVGSRSYLLAPNAEIEDLKARMLEAIRAGGAFVDVDVLGGRRVSVLVSPGFPVTVEATELEADVRDTDEVADPFTTLDDWVL